MTNNKRPLSELLENLVKCGEAYETASIRGVAELDIEVGAIKEEVLTRFGELAEDLRSIAAERDRYRSSLEAASVDRANLLAALVALREWHKCEYQSNRDIDRQADEAIANARRG